MANLITLNAAKYLYDNRKTDGIKNASFEIKENQVTTLLGPSGSGKTTTLKCLDQQLSLQSGEITYHKEVRLAYVAQAQSFTQDITVQNFLLEELAAEETSTEQKLNQIRTTLSYLELTNEIESSVLALSGGQTQRLILARALVHNPTVLLLDEPFANLDNILRKQILREIFDLLLDQEMTIIWVTHDIEEALSFSDKIILFNFGEIQQIGSPQELYYKPSNIFTAEFLKRCNLIASKVTSLNEKEISTILLGHELILDRHKNFKLTEHNDILIIIPPEAFYISSDGPFVGKIEDRIFMGAQTLIEIRIKDSLLQVEIPSYEVPKESTIKLGLNTKICHSLSEI